MLLRPALRRRATLG